MAKIINIQGKRSMIDCRLEVMILIVYCHKGLRYLIWLVYCDKNELFVLSSSQTGYSFTFIHS